MVTFLTKQVEIEGVKKASGNWQGKDGIYAEAAKHHRSKVEVTAYSEEREWSEGQRKWWKGILLPALARHTGDSIAFWETTLKLAVLPDDFEPVTTRVDGIDYTYVPSIAGLSMKKMNIMVEGSVDYLRDEGKWKPETKDDERYRDEFQWVTLPHKPEKEKEND